MTRTGVRSKTGKPPEWDLSDLYAGIDDLSVTRDGAKALARAQQFEKQYRGKIIETLSAETLKQILREYEEILQAVARLLMYAEMVTSTHGDKPEYGAFLQAQRTLFAEVNRHLVFFEVAVAQLSEKALQAWVGKPELALYRHYLEKQLALKTHRLGEEEEKIFSDKALTGQGAWVRLYEEKWAEHTFLVKRGKRVVILNEPQALDLLYEKDRTVRKHAAQSLSKEFQALGPLVTFIYNMVLADKATDDRYRKFANPEADRHLANEVKREVVDTAVEVVVKNYRLVHEYYRFKRKVLGYKTLFHYDRYVSLGNQGEKYSYSQAKEVVLSAFREFSGEFADEAEKFFAGDWIDAAPRAGKRGGAYCQYVTPDKHPYVLVNYTGKAREIMTLAHELGHGVNALLAHKQTFLNFDWPLTLAETASVFGEMLTFDYLKKQAKTKDEKLALLSQRIEDAFATVFRQIAMFRFERLAHAKRSQGEVSLKEFGEMWVKTQREMFGNSLTFGPGYENWWTYIPHFFHTPFYVYSYAFGQLLSLALYAQYQKEGEKMVERYLNFLRAGGSKSPDELLKELGVDWSTPEFWQGGIDQIAVWVKEIKAL